MTDDRSRSETAARTLRDDLERERKVDPTSEWEQGRDAGVERAIELVEAYFDRINVALDARVDDGKKAAGLDPYGYRTDPATGKLVENETEMKAIALAKQLRADYGMSYRQIAQTLWNRGFKNRNGRKFDHKPIIRMIQSTPRKLVVDDPKSDDE